MTSRMRKASGVVRRGGSREKREGQGGYIKGREGSTSMCIYVERIVYSSALGILGKPTGTLHSQAAFPKQIILNRKGHQNFPLIYRDLRNTRDILTNGIKWCWARYL